MSEITLILDRLNGEILVEDQAGLTAAAREFLQTKLGEGTAIACARPLKLIKPLIGSVIELEETPTVRVAGYYHNSLTEGPGRRSSVLFQYCPLKCPGCYVPELHDMESGQMISVRRLAALLLDPKFERDGVTILGGEPFVQSEGLQALVNELRFQGCPHIVCYSGYTLEVLQEKSIKQPLIKDILDEIDLLVDGPFVKSLASGAGLWTGSGNQRVIDLKATRKQGEIVLYQND